MPTPLKPGDPADLGPFRLRSRLHESQAGIVYLGTDPQGRPVSVALLTTAAAGDAAARDRFRTAITAETPPPDPVPRVPPVPGPGDPAPIVAALPQGEAPWVATAYEEGRAGAERFLEPVLLRRGWSFRMRRGPQFQPYWASGPSGPAVRSAALPGRNPAGEAALGDARWLATSVLALAALLGVLTFLAFLLFSCEPNQQVPPPPPIQVPTEPVTPTPSTSAPNPTPSRSGTRTPRPRPTGNGQESQNPADGARLR